MGNKKKKLVVFSGAGMSAESGLKTFRDNDGLWENYKVTDVATPQAWANDKELVLKFYNMRRRQLFKAKPNQAHLQLAELEKYFDVTVITQNIDDLHERAGSSNVIHLHGELKKVQSEKYPTLIYNWDKEDVSLGDTCEKGYQLRPNVVWFGEAVPTMETAYKIATTAEIFIVIGTSLNVYPAAGIVEFVSPNTDCFLIDPATPEYSLSNQWKIINEIASKGIKILMDNLIEISQTFNN